MAQRRSYSLIFICLLCLLFWLNYRKFYVEEADTLIRMTLKDSQADVIEDMDRRRMNVLFVVADDLRPQLRFYQGKRYPNPKSTLQMHTPNIDRLASKSLVLTQAYVQYAVCAPSRSSYMTGRRPDSTQVWDLTTYWRESGGNFTTLPQFFKDHGYETAGVGKIFHPGTSSNYQDPLSWTVPYEPITNHYRLKESWKSIPKDVRQNGLELIDEAVANRSKSLLRSFAESTKSKKQPFFLATGFYKPHMPLVCGEEFFDYYPLEEMDLPEYGFLPQAYPEAAYYASDEFMGRPDLEKYNFTGEMNETFPDDAIRMLRRAYFACVSHIDYLVGELLDELEELGLTNSTVISLVGDHGFHLGENGLWGKHTNFHFSTRAPMMLRIPGRTDAGIWSDSLAEFIDLFPTIVEAAGFTPMPRCPRDSSEVRLCTDGMSLLPLIDRPEERLREAVFSQLRTFKGINGMHYSMRTNRYLYNEVVPFNRTTNSDGTFSYDILWEVAPGVELYDLSKDPGERVNLAYDRRNLRLRAALARQLHANIESFASFQNVKVEI